MTDQHRENMIELTAEQVWAAAAPTASMVAAVLALESSWPDHESDATGIDPGERMAVGVAGLLLCALAGSLSSHEHRASLRDELAGLRPSTETTNGVAAPLVLASGVEVDALGDDARRGLAWLTGQLGQQPAAIGDVLALVDAIRDAEREAHEPDDVT